MRTEILYRNVVLKCFEDWRRATQGGSNPGGEPFSARRATQGWGFGLLADLAARCSFDDVPMHVLC